MDSNPLDCKHNRPSDEESSQTDASPSSPLVADAKRLGKLLTAGERTIRAWDAAGKLPMPTRIGGKVVWIIAEIRDWLAAGAPDRETWEAAKAHEKGRANRRPR